MIDKNSSSSFKLEPYDILSIKPIPLWREGETIELLGEFRFPGIYSIKSGETLLDIIERAGGLSERAYPKGAVFSRENLRLKEEEQKDRLISQLEADLATASLSASDQRRDSHNLAMQCFLVSVVLKQGRLVINLDNILKSKSQDSLLVKSGDILFVRKFLMP